jgi:GntR family transcriptional regulator
LIIIDPRSRTPIFEQIKEQILGLINSGELKPDDKLPSIRQLASELNLNVNTVKHSFQELEIEKVIYSVPAKGFFVSHSAIENTIVIDNATAEIKRILASAKAKGVPYDNILALLNEIYEAGDTND